MSWVILRTMSGERFLCQVDANLAEAVNKRKVVQIKNAYALVTTTVMGLSGASKVTNLEYPDLQQEEPVDMHVLPSAWYPFPEERAKEEIKDLEETMKKAAEFRKEMEAMASAQESGLVQARMVPAGPGMPGVPPGVPIGALTRPPGLK
jgi:hypothetical protein